MVFLVSNSTESLRRDEHAWTALYSNGRAKKCQRLLRAADQMKFAGLSRQAAFLARSKSRIDILLH
jgi:hypothetical protein